MPLFGLKSPALRLLCLPVFLLATVWAQAQTSTVVITQAYGGGGGTGATANYLYNQDYVEIFNGTTASVDISGWSVQYMSTGQTATTSTNVLAIPASTVLAPGQYYLVAGNSSNGTATFSGASLPVTPDVTAAVGSFQISGTGGKVFLVNNSTALTITTSSSTPPNCVGTGIVDYVSMTSAANCVQGTGAAPSVTALSADVRTNSCTSTGDNSKDFTSSTSAVPHSSTSTKTPCGAVTPTAPSLSNATANPATVAQGGNTLLTVKATKGTNPIASVTVNLTAFGGSATQALNDAGTGGDVTAGDGIYSYTLTVPGAQPVSATNTLTFIITDTASTPLTGTATTNLAVTANPNSTNPTLSNPSATPSTVTSGQPTLITVKPVAGTNPTSTSYTSVTADLSQLGGSATQALNDTGASGDATAGDGTYSFSYTVPAGFTPGTYTVTFHATDNDARSAAAVTAQVIVVAPIIPVDSVALSASTSTAVLGSSVSFTAVVTGNVNGATPGGSVTFKDNGNTLGNGTQAPAGTFTYTTTALPLGANVITMVYSGDSTYPSNTTSTPASVTTTITPVPVPSFTLTLANPAIIVSNNAKMGSTVLGVNMVNGFNSTVTFSCSGLPGGSRCTFTPASLSTSGTSTMNVAIDGASLNPHHSPFGNPKAPAVLALLALPLLLRRKLRRKLGVVISALLLGAVLISVTGCSDSASTSTGTSTLTVTATGGGITQTQTISLIVQ